MPSNNKSKSFKKLSKKSLIKKLSKKSLIKKRSNNITRKYYTNMRGGGLSNLQCEYLIYSLKNPRDDVPLQFISANEYNALKPEEEKEKYTNEHNYIYIRTQQLAQYIQYFNTIDRSTLIEILKNSIIPNLSITKDIIFEREYGLLSPIEKAQYSNINTLFYIHKENVGQLIETQIPTTNK